MEPLETLGFGLVGYGCTTCIGNSGPLDEPIAKAVEEHDLVVAAVLSGNRNFEGRIHPLARASYLASPPLVVAFALAGRVDIDLTTEPLGTDRDGAPVFLADLWPAAEEIKAAIRDSLDPELFRRIYASVFDGDDRWRALPVPLGDRYAWDEASTYIARPPFFEGLTAEPAPITDIEGARALAVLGDSVTTDHISPAGSIPAWSPAGQWLQEHGVGPLEFNSYGARRGHHEVMMRGTFGNIRLRNALTEKEGPWTTHQPSGEELFIYDAAMRYAAEGVPLIVIAGQEYGSGSSRDWAAKGTRCSACAPCSPRATSASIAPTWWAWACCRSSSCPATAPEPGPDRPRDVRHRRPRGGARAAPAGARQRPRRGRGADVRGHLPPRRPDRGRLLPAGRHPARGPRTRCRLDSHEPCRTPG